MKRPSRIVTLIISGIFCIHILITIQNDQEVKDLIKNAKAQRKSMPSSCLCTSSKNGKIHNFCYENPQNSNFVGKQFDCSLLPYLENLGIVPSPNFSTENYIDVQNLSRNDNDVVFVGACSDDHLIDQLSSLKAIELLYPNQKYVLYGLNLTEESIERVKNFKNVELRSFDGSKYPEYATHWLEYRFKPLIVAEVLQEYSNVWWMDSHRKFNSPNAPAVLYEDMANHQNSLKSSIVFLSTTLHSNFAVLQKELLSYFPITSVKLLKSRSHGTQLGADRIYFAKTEFTMEIMKWWVLCALDKECMNPPGARIWCDFKDENKFRSHADCFRFDQSVLNLLLLNKFQDYHHFYDEKVDKMSDINRSID